MKTFEKLSLLLFFVCIIFSCSNSGDEDLNNTPEFYNVKYEIIGTGEVSRIKYTDNKETIEEFSVKIPFTKELRYRTESESETYSSGYKNILFWVYNNTGDIQEVRLYIDGELVESQTTPPTNPNNQWEPWSVSYQYLRRK